METTTTAIIMMSGQRPDIFIIKILDAEIKRRLSQKRKGENGL